MPDQTQLVQSIYSSIFNGVASAGAAPGGDSYLCLEWPGMPVSDAEFGNPWTAASQSGSQAATQAFSTMVDQIPSNSPTYFPTGLGVENVYALVLAASVIGPGPAAKMFADAQAQFAATAIGSSLDAAVSYHPSFPQPLNWASAGSAGWTSVSVNLSAPPPPTTSVPANAVQAVRQTIARQGGEIGWRVATINPAAVKHVQAPVRMAPVGTAVKLQAASFASAVHTASAVPLMAPRAVSPAVAAESKVRLDSMVQARVITQALNRMQPTAAVPQISKALLSRLSRLPGGVLQPQVVTQVPPVSTQPVKTQPINSSSLKLNLKCMRVGIVREWLNPLLFRMGNWALEGIAAGSISSGSSATNDGFFPLLPISVIVVRDVSITGTWSSEDKAVAQQATSPGNAAAFGPLTLSTSGNQQSTFDGSTLTVPGMQVVAWYCAPTPKMPPM